MEQPPADDNEKGADIINLHEQWVRRRMGRTGITHHPAGKRGNETAEETLARLDKERTDTTPETDE